MKVVLISFSCLQNENDNALYCGGMEMIFGEEHKDCLSGFGVQHNLNGGKCGICGDPWNSWPR